MGLMRLLIADIIKSGLDNRGDMPPRIAAADDDPAATDEAKEDALPGG
jgi:hypothetical protein